MTMRGDFEAAWWKKYPKDSKFALSRKENGEYYWGSVQDQWQGFQLGYKAALEAAVNVCNKEAEARAELYKQLGHSYQEGASDVAGQLSVQIRQLGGE